MKFSTLIYWKSIFFTHKIYLNINRTQVIKKQLAFGIDTDRVFCMGTGKNYTFLKKLNEKHQFFKEVVPLEHPRYVMQYKMKTKAMYIEKYISALNK